MSSGFRSDHGRNAGHQMGLCLFRVASGTATAERAWHASRYSSPLQESPQIKSLSRLAYSLPRAHSDPPSSTILLLLT